MAQTSPTMRRGQAAGATSSAPATKQSVGTFAMLASLHRNRTYYHYRALQRRRHHHRPLGYRKDVVAHRGVQREGM